MPLSDKPGLGQWCIMTLLAKSIFMFLFGAFAASANIEKHFESKEICSQGLAQCNVTAENSVIPPSDFGPVEGMALDARPAFCCKTDKKCRACVVVKITFKIKNTSASEEKNREASVLLCYTSGPNVYCRRIRFVVTNNAHERESIEVVEYDIAFLGSSVNVSGLQTAGVLSKLKSPSVNFPKFDEVCPDSTIEECNICSDTDRKEYNIGGISVDVNRNKGVVTIKGDGESQLLTCVSRKQNGTCWKSNLNLPLDHVTPCMCFQVWKNDCFRTEICPFKHNHTDLRGNVLKEMQISAVHFVTSAGQTALSWNLKSPCSVEAEVLLYRKNSGWRACCEEVQRITINNKSVWDENISTMWTEGAFTNLSSSDQFFVMYKVDGKVVGPACQCTDSSTLLLIIFILLLLIFIMGIVTAYMLQSRIKVWILKQASPPREQRGEVLLVHSSTSDPSLSNQACRFGSLLSELGFSVTLDLWDPISVSSVGPTPWLHSQLQCIQKRGGKTLLLLSPDALCRARAFWESGNGKSTSSWSSDVFGSVLTSIYATHKNGGAEYFALVQFGSELPDMPELFHGLRLYQLPAESRSFLTDLYVGGLESTRVKLKRFFWIYKAAMKLQQDLNGHCAEHECLLYDGIPA